MRKQNVIVCLKASKPYIGRLSKKLFPNTALYDALKSNNTHGINDIIRKIRAATDFLFRSSDMIFFSYVGRDTPPFYWK